MKKVVQTRVQQGYRCKKGGLQKKLWRMTSQLQLVMLRDARNVLQSHNSYRTTVPGE